MQHAIMRLGAISLFLTILLFSCSSPLKQMPPNISAGGRAVAIARHPSNEEILIVASESGGLFRSGDGGLNWQQVSGSTTFWFKDVKYYSRNPNIVIAAAGADTQVKNGGGIWRSTDGGTNWVQIQLHPMDSNAGKTLSAYCIAIDTSSGKIWIGTSCGLAYSVNEGVDWTFVASSANYNNDAVYAVLAPVSRELKILTDFGVKVSSDDGVNWSYSTTGLPWIGGERTQGQLSCSPYNHRHLYWACNYWPDTIWHRGLFASFDNGNTWTNMVDNTKINRPPICRTARSLDGIAGHFDLYFSSGEWDLARKTFTEPSTGNPTQVNDWESLTTQHADYADIAFGTDQRTPILLVGDGGLQLTADKGKNWKLAGAVNAGYNALQITEVAGQQHAGDTQSDIYYGTQDNDLRASGDMGATWPGDVCCEGFDINLPRKSLPAGQTKVSFVSCWSCGNYWSDPLMTNAVGFPNAPFATGGPRLIKPAYYLQSDTVPGNASISDYAITKNNGQDWMSSYSFANPYMDLPTISGKTDSPIVYTPVNMGTVTPDNQPVIGLMKTIGILADGGSVVSSVTGFGSIGTFPTMFEWYKPFGADSHDPDHLIVADLTTDSIRVTYSGGMGWHTDEKLTDLVTQSGRFKFHWDGFTQVSNISFDPDVDGHILVGTVQAGIFNSCDNGGSWSKIAGSEMIPNVSGFYFVGNNTNDVIVSSYGRGLWKMTLAACPVIKFPKFNGAQLETPLIYYQGVLVPLNQVHNPDVCPKCAFYVLDQGEIAEVNMAPGTKNNVAGIRTSSGRIRGYTKDHNQMSTLPFSVGGSNRKFDTKNDLRLKEIMEKGYHIKGVYLDGNTFKGLILAKRDIKPDELPLDQAQIPFLRPQLIMDEKTGTPRALKLLGRGFTKQTPIELFIDGKRVGTDKQPFFFNERGTIEIRTMKLLTPGGHVILVRQRNGLNTLQQATQIMVPKHDTR